MASFYEQIFVTIQDKRKIKSIIDNVPNPDFNYKIQTYLSYQAQHLLKLYYPRFALKTFEIYTFPYLPNWFFLVLITNPNTNHPFLLFANLDDNKIRVIRPIGKERGQVEIPVFFAAIPQCTQIERFAILFFLDRTIFIRKNALLYIPQFTLINCRNISNCVRKMHEIARMKVSKGEKEKLVAKYDTFYKEKAIDFLQNYFEMLNKGEYDEAFLFLRGDRGKYFKKERLNTFFRDTKPIIGHLQIFIELYRLLNHLRSLMHSR